MCTSTVVATMIAMIVTVTDMDAYARRSSMNVDLREGRSGESNSGCSNCAQDKISHCSTPLV